MTGFEVLADPGRRTILRLLLDGERSVGALVSELGLAQPNVSRHLRILREAGFVAVRPRARERLYRLQPGRLEELDAWLAPFRAAWAARLDRLEAHLDALED